MDAACEAAFRAYCEGATEEAGGLITPAGFVPVRNIAPPGRFTVAPQDYLKAGQVLGMAHYHPQGTPPSEWDRVGCQSSQIPWFVLSGGVIHRLTPRLLGRSFVWGVSDCYTIIQDVYRQLGLQLPNFHRDATTEESGLYLANYHACGFEQVPSLLPGDVVLMGIPYGKTNHAAVYLGENVIVHHLRGRLSSREVYGGYYLKVTTHRLRNPCLPPLNYTDICKSLEPLMK